MVVSFLEVPSFGPKGWALEPLVSHGHYLQQTHGRVSFDRMRVVSRLEPNGRFMRHRHLVTAHVKFDSRLRRVGVGRTRTQWHWRVVVHLQLRIGFRSHFFDFI